MNNIEKIEKLREAVIKKHFKHYYGFPGYVVGINCTYLGTYDEREAQERAIDNKVIYYIKLDITADDLIK